MHGVTRRSAGAALVVVALALPQLSCESDDTSLKTIAPIRSSKTLGTTHGPNGEPATPTGALDLTPTEIAKVRAGHYTAAFLWHENAQFTTAVSNGARDVFNDLGVNVIAEASADFDAARQKAELETVEARHPSALLTLPVDPVVTASAYKAAARQGIKIVLLSILPQGMKQGPDYVNVVTDDLFQMGKRAADALAAAVGDEGKIAYFFRDANSYVTNQRDQAFLKTITTNYPRIEVVAKDGIADPTKAQEQAAALLLKNPDLSGAYVTFSEPPGEGVLAALRARGNDETKLVSLDISDPMALDMAKGGNTTALVVDRAYELGRAMATSAAYGLLGKKAPAFIVAPAMTITRSTLVQGYRASLHRDPPASVLKALGQ
jgi:ribose transport system substrate-binding protein